MTSGSVHLGVDDILNRLERVRRAGDQRWTALCPAHGDKRPSLSVRLADDGKVLLNDFAGCTFTEILAAIGIEPRQLFPESTSSTRPPQRRRSPQQQALNDYERFLARMRPPSTERMRGELEFIGFLLLGGSTEYARLAATFEPETIRTSALRVVFSAIAELARQGTPRRWFSPHALAREVDAVAGPGRARRLDLYGWCRSSIRTARASGTGKAALHAR